MFDLQALESAAQVVYQHMAPTPQFQWPLLAKTTGIDVWVKHENHTPTGAFKVRGGFVYMTRLKKREPATKGVISATRGNHGQSIAMGAASAGVAAVIVVPRGNSVEKNAAMKAFGAELIEYGEDFDEAKDHAAVIAKERDLAFVPSYHEDLVCGVGSYALELFRAAGDLDRVYVPLGLGSGLCGVICARDALGLNCDVIGVVAEGADAYAKSFVAGHIVNINAAKTFADGMAVRLPDPNAFEIIKKGAADIIKVSDQEIAEAMRLYYRTIHTIAEGAGAAALAGLLQQKSEMQGKKVGVILSGQNIDMPWYQDILANRLPVVAKYQISQNQAPLV